MMHIGRGGTGNVAKAEDSSPPSGPAASDKQPSPSPALLAADKGKDKENLQKVKSRASSDGDHADAGDDDVAVPARKPEEVGWAEKGRNLLFGKK
ncbi:hypothetical protein N657DRAFT_639260 [Parathielavia appendiculata]|uniref:Uncharacterized protein n=1 Tax=Parathielavia appendiculata TaxID=2587402 RepID=A0AAN6Z918_9PEZI|nr:hypothetical protein N657DRAFT_639260 [Parathielavia appendiculata]